MKAATLKNMMKMEEELHKHIYSDTEADRKLKFFNEQCEPKPVNTTFYKEMVFGKIRRAKERRRKAMLYLGIAASVAILFGVAVIWNAGGDNKLTALGENVKKKVNVELCSVTVPVGKTQIITLADGTTLIANSRTKVTYPKTFVGKERVISIEGEAVIDVVHDDNHPFMVKANGFEITDVGTRFVVSNYDATNADVVLVEGAVDITTKKADRISMKPGNLVNISNGEIAAMKTVDTSKYTCWTKGYMSLDGETVGSLTKRLSNYYGHKITCTREISGMRLYGKLLIQDNVESVVKSIEAIVPVKVNTRGDTTSLKKQ